MAQKPPATPSGDFTFTPPLDLETAFSMNQRNIDAVGEMNQKLYKAMQTCNEELVSFGSRRLKQDFAIPQQLAECKTPNEVVNFYSEFFQTAFKQYSDEANTLAQIANNFTKETFDSFQHEMEATVETVDSNSVTKQKAVKDDKA